MNKKLLDAIRGRGRKSAEFGYGIHTADVFVRTMAERIGLEPCYRCVSTKQTSFDDIIQKAAETLVYSNPDMQVEEKARRLPGLPKGVELPKNTLMVFKHTLTSSNKDRDGDILRSEGMELDPNMLLLWQHVSTMPIGKFLAVNQQNSKRVKVYSCIVDMNETSHDAAVMVDNGMGRFSHGFRALEYEEMKDGTDIVGFDVKRAEIMEESLVSVPANIDAETEDVLLSLVEGGKLTSPLMKEYGKSLREHRPVTVPGTSITYRENVGDAGRELSCNSFADLKAAAEAGLIVGGKGNDDENEPGSGSEKRPEGTASPSKETDENQDETGAAGDSEIALDEKGIYVEGLEGSWEWISDKLRGKTKPYLISQGIKITEDNWISVLATYPKNAIVRMEGASDSTEYYQVGWVMKGKEPEYNGKPKPVEVNASVETMEKNTDKAGRTLSKANESKIQEAKEDVDEVVGMDGTSRSCKALLKQASRGLETVLDEIGGEAAEPELTTKDAMAYVLFHADRNERDRMEKSIEAINSAEDRSKKTRQFRSIVGRIAK